MEELIHDLFMEVGIPGKLALPVARVLSAVLVLVIGIIVIRIILSVTRKALERSSLDPVLYRFILTAIKVILYIVLVLMIVSVFGANLSGIITMLAAAGAAIALALKDSLANIAGGLMILITKPFTQDDFIDIDGTTGKVRDIDLFVTHLKTYDNKVISIPNGMVNTAVLINYSQENKRRVDCCFGIGYEDNIDQAKTILAEIAKSNPDIYQDPEPIIGVAGQRDHCIELDLKVWCETEQYSDVKYFLEENVKLAFDKAGITIPFPQMDVNLKK